MRFAVAFGFLVVTAKLGGSQVPGDKPQPNYLPLKVGSEWQFKANINGKQTSITTQIAAIEVINGVPMARLETSLEGKVTYSEYLSSTAKGIFRHRFNGVEVTPPICVLRYPPKKGDSWESEHTLGAQKVKMKMKCQVDEDQVEVPAGKYKAVTMNLVAEVMGMKVSGKYWFVDGVGFVKQSSDLGGQMTVVELEKYVPGK